MNREEKQNWFFNYDEAIEESKRTRKPVMIQFERERCSGCKKLYAVTYPDKNVTKELFEWFIPLRLDILKDRELRRNYSAVWTPSFYFIDFKGKLFFSFAGYLLPEDFRIILRMGLASVYIPKGKYAETIQMLEEAIDLFPNNPRTPSLMLKLGMARYLRTWDNKNFRADMDEIRKKFPNSAEARMWAWEDEHYQK